MNRLGLILLLSVAIAGCQSASTVEPTDKLKTNTNAEDIMQPVLSSKERETALYPTIEYSQIRIASGSQTLTAANKLADELGVEFVEWARDLNPYQYYQHRSKRINLNFADPQGAFLSLFDRSGLLPVYDQSINTVTVFPFSLDSQVNQPHIFTPQFDRSKKQREEIERDNSQNLAGKNRAIEYHYYKGFTVKQTVDAWAKHANFKSVVWYFNEPTYLSFLDNEIQKNDFTVGRSPLDVISKFLESEKKRQNRDLLITATLETQSNRLILHPFSSSEIVRSFEVRPTSTKHNLVNIAKFYGYDLDYRAKDYQIPTGYITILSQYTEKSIEEVIQQYPLKIEVVDSVRKIIVRGTKS
ncbi:hypothetical protein ACPV5U_24305 [Vibrio mediterranei]